MKFPQGGRKQRTQDDAINSQVLFHVCLGKLAVECPYGDESWHLQFSRER